MNENEYNQYCNGCKLIFDYYGEENQLNKLIEECSELIRAISRKDKVNILEEVADVQLLIERFANDYLETFKENEKLKIQLMQKSEVDTFFNTPIEGWDNDACKICEYKQNYQAKEQECEELKKQHEQYKPFYELGAKCTQLNEVADGLSNKCDKYKQALDEIEEFIKSQLDDFGNDVYSMDKSAINNIQDIINNVKEE